MDRVINMDNLRSFAYSNHSIVKPPICGIVISFFGLGCALTFDRDTDEGIRFAEKGILYLIPYHDPWAWMNRQTVSFTDELVDVLIEGCSLPEDVPVVSTGGSMGGLSALVYTAYAKRTPVSCVANCPVCDLPYHFTERPDLPRTLYSAFGGYPCSLEEAMRSASPLHLAKDMPRETAYYIFHCEKDEAVNKEKHSDRFVEVLSQDHRVEYYSVPDRGHCSLTEEMARLYEELAVRSVCRKADPKGD